MSKKKVQRLVNAIGEYGSAQRQLGIATMTQTRDVIAACEQRVDAAADEVTLSLARLEHKKWL